MTAVEGPLLKLEGITVSKSGITAKGQSIPFTELEACAKAVIKPSKIGYIIMIAVGAGLAWHGNYVSIPSDPIGGPAVLLLGFGLALAGVLCLSCGGSASYRILITRGGVRFSLYETDNETLADQVLIAMNQAMAEGRDTGEDGATSVPVS